MGTRTHTTAGPSAVGTRRRRADAPAATHDLVVLQRVAGNAAVGRMIVASVQRQPKRPAPAPSPPAPVAQGAGLAGGPEQDRYVDAAIKLWSAKRSMKLTDFAAAMLRTIATELAGHGIPAVKTKLDPKLGTAGRFQSDTWLLSADPGAFSANPGARTLADITVAEVTEIVGTLYHEARHADQDVLIIRVLLGRKRTVDQIVTATNIDRSTVEAVRRTTYSDTPDAAAVDRADRMFDVMYGRYDQLLTFLIHHADSVGAVGGFGQAGTTADAARDVAVVLAWRTTGLAAARKALAAVATPTAAELALATDLHAVDTAIAALAPAWRSATARRAKAADVAAARPLATAVFTAIDTAYRHLEGERDAFQVEADVKARFTKRATP